MKVKKKSKPKEDKHVVYELLRDYCGQQVTFIFFNEPITNKIPKGFFNIDHRVIAISRLFWQEVLWHELMEYALTQYHFRYYCNDVSDDYNFFFKHTDLVNIGITVSKTFTELPLDMAIHFGKGHIWNLKDRDRFLKAGGQIRGFYTDEAYYEYMEAAQ